MTIIPNPQTMGTPAISEEPFTPDDKNETI